MCGPRTASLTFADGTPVSFADVVMDISDLSSATLSVTATSNYYDIGTHTLKLTYALQMHPTITVSYDFNVIFLCDFTEAVSLNIDSSPPSLTF